MKRVWTLLLIAVVIGAVVDVGCAQLPLGGALLNTVSTCGEFYDSLIDDAVRDRSASCKRRDSCVSPYAGCELERFSRTFNQSGLLNAEYGCETDEFSCCIAGIGDFQVAGYAGSSSPLPRELNLQYEPGYDGSELDVYGSNLHVYATISLSESSVSSGNFDLVEAYVTGDATASLSVDVITKAYTLPSGTGGDCQDDPTPESTTQINIQNTGAFAFVGAQIRDATGSAISGLACGDAAGFYLRLRIKDASSNIVSELRGVDAQTGAPCIILQRFCDPTNEGVGCTYYDEDNQEEEEVDPGCVLSHGTYKKSNRRDQLACPASLEANLTVCGTALGHVLTAVPKRGDARVILARQYVAAVLNLGCGIPQSNPNATDALLIEDAGTFLASTCDVDLTAHTTDHARRGEALYFAEKLDAFNNAKRSVSERCNLTELLAIEDDEDNEEDTDKGKGKGKGNGNDRGANEILDNLFVGRHSVQHIDAGDAQEAHSGADTLVISVTLTASVAAITTIVVLVYA